MALTTSSLVNGSLQNNLAGAQAIRSQAVPAQAQSAPTPQAAAPQAAPQVQQQAVTTPQNALPAYVDPYAGTPWGSKAAYEQAVNDYNSAKNNTYGSISDATTDAGNKYNSSILDYIDQLKTGQKAIDRSAIQNDLAKEQGRLGILDMVGTGLRSGGVTLNNANAANSSAAEQLGKAYNQIGRAQMTQVGNQYALGQNNIQGQQEALDQGTATFQRHLGESKVSTVNGIVQQATQQLASLNAAAQGASLPDRIAIEGEKNRIRNDAMAKLTAYDGVLTEGIKNNGAMSAENRRAEAQKLLTAGTAPESAYNYTSSVPTQFQGSGPFASNLPIFVAPRKDDQGA